MNVQGLVSHAAEIAGRLRLLPKPPMLLCINETFLDKSIGEVQIEGYSCISRHDRADGRRCGGVATYALSKYSHQVTCLGASCNAEREWVMIHSNHGPIVVANWYRPPCHGEVSSILALGDELQKHRDGALGVIVVGDLNVHSRKWLRHSSHESPEGQALQSVCEAEGLRQVVRAPTRGEHLLDLVLSDIDDVEVEVLAPIADHRLVSTRLQWQVPTTIEVEREVWSFSSADWVAVFEALEENPWEELLSSDVDEGVHSIAAAVTASMERGIPRRQLRQPKCSHPWITPTVVAAIKDKVEAAGTEHEKESAEQCSARILQEFDAYTVRMRQKLREQRPGSKQWWSMSRQLMQMKGRVSSIPALRAPDGSWVKDPAGKAALFAKTFAAKQALPDLVVNEYTTLHQVPVLQGELDRLSVEHVERVLASLREDSATGPDQLPTRVLKKCAHILAQPVCHLAQRILDSGQWPVKWREHWIVPVYKKKSVYDAKNYRGIHITSQLSKILERVLLSLLTPFLEASGAHGANQFAYRKKRGARDCLAAMSLQWISSMNRRQKTAVYCSDVSGAFDRVDTPRMVAKLQSQGVHPKLVSVFTSWLQQRAAFLVVEGSHSEALQLADMVYQGTVFGPTFWNLFYADASRAIRKTGFAELVYADDLNAYKEFDGATPNDTIVAQTMQCQSELHMWGAANRVSFDPVKESMHVISHVDPHGETFRILGVTFDSKLIMATAVQELVTELRWKLRTLLRATRFMSTSEQVLQFKARLLSYVEYRTPGIYHACSSLLDRIDAVQRAFLREVGLSAEDAITRYSLAPLESRRDIAMLGVIHRAALGEGPEQLHQFFRVQVPQPSPSGTRDSLRRHRRQLVDPRSPDQLDVHARSAHGLVAVYNLLPSDVVALGSVRAFQSVLQAILKDRATRGECEWARTFSPRLRLHTHPLRAYRWNPSLLEPLTAARWKKHRSE